MYLVVRTALDPAAMTAAIRAEIKKLDPVQNVSSVQTMQQILDNSTTQPRFQAAAIGIFGGMALAISMVGLYGVISYAVARRTHEIGVRVALGASRGRVMGMVVRQALGLGALGIAVGIAGSLALTRVIKSFLFETSPTDPATFAGISAILMLVILFAVWIPARRAMRVDPVIALRYE